MRWFVMVFVVVGGGIFGLFTAYHLVNEGVDVTIIEQSEPGAWSRATAGLIEYGMFGSNFINVPGYVMKFLRMVRSGDAAIRYVSTEWVLRYLRSYGQEVPGNYLRCVEVNQ
jgi:D-proline dehydrogenase